MGKCIKKECRSRSGLAGVCHFLREWPNVLGFEEQVENREAGRKELLGTAVFVSKKKLRKSIKG